MRKFKISQLLPILFLVMPGILLSQVTSVQPGPERRLALVIGNSKYINSGELANPVNDARAIRDALQQVGFDVFEYENLSQSQMKMAIDNFGMKLKGYSVGLFFYAGHGIQSKGANYLIPVDANLQTEQQVEYDCVQADRVLGFMEAAGSKVNIVILDACRNNPFERSWSRSVDGSGLAFMAAPTGSLIAYSTSPGRTASDGSGSNGLYTSALLENLKSPDLNILQMFQNVRRTVSDKSKKQQIPWESTSLTADFFFASKQASKENVNLKAVWVRTPDDKLIFYVDDQDITGRMVNNWCGDDFLLYDPVTNITCLIEKFFTQPVNKPIPAKIVGVTANAYWMGNKDFAYYLYVKGDEIAYRTKNIQIAQDLIVYDSLSNTTYIFYDFKKNCRNVLVPATILNNSEFAFWKKVNGAYWLISRGQNAQLDAKSLYIENDLLVYDNKTNITYLLKDYLLDSNENRFLPAQVVSYQDNVFWRKIGRSYYLIRKGEFFQQQTKSYWKGSDLYVTDTLKNVTYILPDYETAPINQLKVPIVN